MGMYGIDWILATRKEINIILTGNYAKLAMAA